ncbi:MAG TPA: serine hydrolase, partial [Flavisolibacter sp.]|nr:serine hydrolase [Flavisolibacter sp.]
YRLRKMNLKDHEKLPSVKIAKPEKAYPFSAGRLDERISHFLDSVLPSTQTAAFLVIRNDSILYERYFQGFDDSSLLPSNSMAKSFIGTLTGMAVDEGRIGSVSDPVTAYLPELLERDSNFARITIQHLLDMRSGLNFNEGSYTLKDDAIRLGLRRNLEKHLLRASIAKPPGQFRYQSINTQLLGLVIERASGEKLEDYLYKKLWQPLGMENGATWNVDSRRRKQVLISAGINATARDFAKLGRLYLANGRWKGQQLLQEDWVDMISNIDTMQYYGGYKYQWWSRMAYQYFEDSLDAEKFKRRTSYSGALRKTDNGFQVNYRTSAYHANGFLSQIIFVHPLKQLIIVRLGKRWKHPERFSSFIYNLGERM